jgi:NAD(P)-dependent dehydrogenase (short-subunit alcohol dehydrogenase family)
MTSNNKPVALVTGGSSGIGLAIARRFVELGMQVVLVGRRQGAVDAAASKLGAAAVGLAADVTSPADLERLFIEVKTRFGRLDVLVPNAGGGQHAPLGQITEAQFDQQFATNVKGVVFTVQQPCG